MTAGSARQGLLDTSTVILLPRLTDLAVLPNKPLISTITLAELSVGPLVTTSAAEQAARQAHVQQAEADFDPLPFDVSAARAFGRVAAALRSAGSKPTARAYDALIAAVAVAHELPLYTCNEADFRRHRRSQGDPRAAPARLLVGRHQAPRRAEVRALDATLAVRCTPRPMRHVSVTVWVGFRLAAGRGERCSARPAASRGRGGSEGLGSGQRHRPGLRGAVKALAAGTRTPRTATQPPPQGRPERHRPALQRRHFWQCRDSGIVRLAASTRSPHTAP
ncbi:MAG: type II toxin-antitoxin system VapC family toxin [Pseudonocardiaceae bacterium]